MVGCYDLPLLAVGILFINLVNSRGPTIQPTVSICMISYGLIKRKENDQDTQIEVRRHNKACNTNEEDH